MGKIFLIAGIGKGEYGGENMPISEDNILDISSAEKIEEQPKKTTTFLVRNLPTSNIYVGKVLTVTDALEPKSLKDVQGGGNVVCQVSFNGTNWVSLSGNSADIILTQNVDGDANYSTITEILEEHQKGYIKKSTQYTPINSMLSVTQSEYDAILEKEPTTLYFIQ